MCAIVSGRRPQPGADEFAQFSDRAILHDAIANNQISSGRKLEDNVGHHEELIRAYSIGVVIGVRVRVV